MSNSLIKIDFLSGIAIAVHFGSSLISGILLDMVLKIFFSELPVKKEEIIKQVNYVHLRARLKKIIIKKGHCKNVV